MILPQKLSLFDSPSPLQYLPTLSRRLKLELYCKRDDLLEPGLGGTQLRKLSYCFAEAKREGASLLLVEGSSQSDLARVTAAVAARYGLRCAIVCPEHYPNELSGNLLLCRMLGAEVVFCRPAHSPDAAWLERAMAQVRRRYEAQGEQVYPIPLGGSNPVGTAGLVDCAAELSEQAKALGLSEAAVFCPVGTLGTYMGLTAGFAMRNAPLSVRGVAIRDFAGALPERVARFGAELAEAWQWADPPHWSAENIATNFLGGGYGAADAGVRKALYLMAQREGILLDPCCNGKCFAAILALRETGQLRKGETVILLHTGGVPALSAPAYREGFTRDCIGGVTVLD